MPETLNPLRPMDEVHIKSLNMYGEVLRVLPGDTSEPEEERLYEVQITRYFRRTDLEVYDREAEKQKRDAARREAMGRLSAANKELQRFVDGGGDINSPIGIRLGIELFKAANDVWVVLGHDPLQVPTRIL